MKKINFIFPSIILLELILIIIFLLLGNSCGSACDPHGLLNPFGYVLSSGESTECIAVCAYTPYPLFYIVVDLLILTIVIYSFRLIIKLMRRFTQPSAKKS